MVFRAKISYKTVQLLLLSAAVGVLSGFIAIGFRYLIYFFQNLFFFGNFSFENSDNALIHNHIGWTIIFIPAIGGLLVGLITHFFASEAKGHGVPEVMEAVSFNDGKMKYRTVFFKALASAITIGSGGSVGREGPIVQIGSAAGSTIAQWLKFDTYHIKVLLGAGAASGIAATFNTPIAGIVFALEIILMEVNSKSFIAMVIATFFGTIVSRIFLGSEPAFHLPAYAFHNNYETFFYLILGVLAGFAGLLLIKSVYFAEDIFNKIKIYPFLKPAIGGLLVGCIGIFFPEVFGVGYITVSNILNHNILITTVILLFFAKFLAFIITIGSGASGGIFSPSLFLGATLGAAFGYLVNYFFPEISAPPGAYALVGMAALFGAAARATLTSIIIIFELTLDYKIILPLMFTCVIADLICWSYSKESIYTQKLARKRLSLKNSYISFKNND
ncbi:MAG: chloride channel protein [Calditrichaeota bacterium]|nr:MAG: chloride channel protein [Calditrichota bacterium]